MGVAGTVARLVASLAQNQRVVEEILKTLEHHSLKIYIYQSAICQVDKILAFESFLDPHACQRNPWIELHQ